jgi:hypothetical protein
VKEYIVTKMIRFGVVALVLLMATGVRAQGDSQAQEAKPRAIPVKIQLLLSRYQGEKKISSVPYVLWVTANTETRGVSMTNLRMGVKIPIATAPGAGTYQYQDVGTNIDCLAQIMGDGTFRVGLTVSDSSVYFAEKDKPQGVPQQVIPTGPTVPTFRSFTSNFSILLRDGQTAQYTSATDQVSGEVLKIDATLNVLM